MQTNTITTPPLGGGKSSNNSGGINGIQLGGISLGVILGGILVYSTWATNRFNKKLMEAQMKKLNSEGFYSDDDIFDKALETVGLEKSFAQIQEMSAKSAPVSTAPSTSISSADGNELGVEQWEQPNLSEIVKF